MEVMVVFLLGALVIIAVTTVVNALTFARLGRGANAKTDGDRHRAMATHLRDAGGNRRGVDLLGTGYPGHRHIVEKPFGLPGKPLHPLGRRSRRQQGDLVDAGRLKLRVQFISLLRGEVDQQQAIDPARAASRAKAAAP